MHHNTHSFLFLALLLAFTTSCDAPQRTQAPRETPLQPSTDPMLQGTCPQGALPFGGSPPFHTRLVCRLPNGTPHGPDKTWDELGKLRQAGQYTQGKREGLWFFYFRSGRKKASGAYKNGLKQGRWTAWKKSGSVRAHTWYEDGQVVAGEHPQGKQ